MFGGHVDWSQVPKKHTVTSMYPLPTGKPKQLPKIQYSFPTESKSERSLREERQHAVLDAFKRAWLAYKDHAWMADELTPISGDKRNTFAGWAATLVDALDTLWIMGLKDEFNEAVAAAVSIDFASTSQDEINVFETTIRYMGGFLSAYDLSADERLLVKAKELGEMLLHAFDTPNHMPITRWRVMDARRGAPQTADPVTLVAEIGSLVMEFTRLSQITRDPRWFDATHRVMKLFEEQQSKTNVPGMWPILVNARDMDLTWHDTFTLGAMSDSAYEYLPKMHALLGGLEPMYENMYKDAMTAAIRYTLWRPMTPDNADILIAGMAHVNGEHKGGLDFQGQHLVCFAGGMLALGGKLFNDQNHLDMGRKVTDGCIWTYKAMPLGIMPEVFHMVECPTNEACQWDEKAWHKEVQRRKGGDVDHLEDIQKIIAEERLPPGFSSLDDRRYILRPEAIESVFILYRITGRKDLQETAWQMFNAIQDNTKTELANGALSDVSRADGKVTVTDSMESFWLAETLKYFYLIFSEPGLISLDEYTFNTEAHPFKIPK
ncbi:seven-hairpin glycosidase [Aureobasidium namibiae CBS 147.97]|uniref:alpha-1,2-Mannosidase n=1 Tax=Aureobasidium namibiae CBS 147.97 TaxID=1043004 RepID=A0A074X5A1_9PEZI|nr:seven-hairpin glycosidase [Aureobasidium namibiae CBS 147.97]KEQ77247.1 seven-hairpin glycosidase [Aureobasidium namibiae CBS 147.97]